MRGKVLSTLLSSTTNSEYELRCCISYSERKQRMMIKLWIDRKLKEIMSPGTKSFPIFNDFERNYFFGFKSEPSFSPPSSVWTWQSLSVCLALIVLLVFLVIELDYLPSVLQYLSTRRKHLGDFNYVHFVWVLTRRLCNKGVLRRCRETDYLFTSLPAPLPPGDVGTYIN